MNEWQPIETAPKDGTRILLAGKHGVVPMIVGYWEASCQVWVYDFFEREDEFFEIVRQPTDWMELPEPPE